jgi:integrase
MSRTKLSVPWSLSVNFGFIGQLRDREATAALALEFCILTAARSGEVLGAKWSEIDLQQKLWTVPGKRMKAGREQRVPLSPRAVSILKGLAQVKLGEYVFAGRQAGKPLCSQNAVRSHPGLIPRRRRVTGGPLFRRPDS